MSPQPQSSAWHRVAGLQPRLRSHVRIHRHEYRGQLWYVVEDRISRRTHRFNPAAWYVIGLMDGRRSVQQIWDAAVERFAADAPTQDEVIQLLAQLHLAEIVQCDVTPDVDELLRRQSRVRRVGWVRKLMSPLAVRFPLLDPERLLERLLPFYRPAFGRVGAAVWFIVVGLGVLTAARHWGELTLDLSHRVLAPQNLIIIGLVFPVIKALHEFGHACAVKAWGGEVHEMGIMLLVLMPVPYVDASAASTFPQKHRRVLVGAAGMAVELFLASIALFFWLELETGLLRAILFNAMLIAGVSTVLFNANPLLRFDGYYMLADLIEIPNLRQRGQQYLGAIFQRRLFGAQVAVPEMTRSERTWMSVFVVASFAYRTFIMFAIAIFLASEYLVVGVLLAIWAVASSVMLPLVALAYHIALSPRLNRHRSRAALTTAALAAAVIALVGLVPLPSWTHVQGVVALPEQMAIRGGADGFVVGVMASPGSRVRRGDPLVVSKDPLLQAQIQLLEARRAELEARYQLERVDKLVRSQMTLDQIVATQAEIARAREREDDLTLRSPADGTFALPVAQDLPGRYLKRGEQVGYVVAGTGMTVRVVVAQQAADLVRRSTERVRVKLAERASETLFASVVREVPAASDRLPSMALSQVGGGEVALDPTAGTAMKTLQTYFEFEVGLPAGETAMLGGRAYVRFEHRPETLSEQGWRWLRQLFLRRLAI